MGVLVASFAGTTLDTACRLQRYVIQELAATLGGKVNETDAKPALPFAWLQNKHGATVFAITVATLMAFTPHASPKVPLSASLSGQVTPEMEDASLAKQTQTDAREKIQKSIDQMKEGGATGMIAWLTAYSGKGWAHSLATVRRDEPAARRGCHSWLSRFTSGGVAGRFGSLLYRWCSCSSCLCGP